MEFGRKILGKYGWKDGDGLGKNNDGIAKPLKATLKYDTAGFGADQAASDFNNHWWQRVFNDAASNLSVKQEGESIQMALVDSEEEVEISTKSYSVKKLKKAKLNKQTGSERSMKNSYGNFLLAATQNAGGEVLSPDHINASDIEVTKIKVLSDEDLFKACGGRTAHKGARHGLKQSGKLARLEQQEEELLANMLAQQNSVSETLKTKKKHKRKSIGKSDIILEREDENLSPKENPKKQKRKLSAQDTSDISTSFHHEITNCRTKKKKDKEVLEETNTEKNQSCAGFEPINNSKSNKKKTESKSNKISKDAITANDGKMRKPKIVEEILHMLKDGAGDNTGKHKKTKKSKKSKFKKDHK